MNRCKELWSRMLVTSLAVGLMHKRDIAEERRSAILSRHRQNVDAWFDEVEAEMKRREASGYLWSENVRLASKAR